MVDLIRGDVADRLVQRLGVQQVARDDSDPVAQMLGQGQRVPAAVPSQADDLVAPVEQQLSEKGTVLAGDAGDQRAPERRGHDEARAASSLWSASTINRMSCSKLVCGSQPRMRVAFDESPIR